MGEKSKYIIIVLVVAVLAGLGASIYMQGLKKAVELERDTLNGENASLNRKIEETQQKVNALQASLNKISQEKKDLENQRDELKQQFDLMAQQRDDFLEQIKAAEQARKEEKKKDIPFLTEDSYLEGILKAKIDLELELEKISRELKTTQRDIEELHREKSAAEAAINDLAREKRSLEQQVEYNQKTVDSLSAELAREKNAKRNLQENSIFLKNENIVLKKQLKAASNHKISLQKKIVQLQEEKNKLENNLTDVGSLLEDKYSQIGELKNKVENIHLNREAALDEIKPPAKESIELPPIIVHSQADTSAAQKPEDSRALSGKVLAINKENNFVVIDLGTESGVKIGQDFKVYQGGKSVAGIEVIEARSDISACDIKKEITPIKIGNIVK